jgi:uncharacterized protein DUF5309
MAIITSAIGTDPQALGAGSARVHAEDVMDMVFDKSAFLTPVSSTLPRAQAKAKTVEWIIDKLQTTGDPNTLARAETTPAFNTALVTFQKRTRLFTQTQNFRAELEVHDFVDTVLDAFGVADEYNYQGKKKMKLLGVGVEKAMFKDITAPSTAATGAAANHGGTDPATWVDPTRCKPLVQQIQHKTLEFGFSTNYMDANDMSRITLNPAGGSDSGLAILAVGDLPAQNIRINEDIINAAAAILTGTADEAFITPDRVILSTAPYGHIGNFGSVSSPATATPGKGYGPLHTSRDMNLARIARVVKVYGTQFGDMAFIHDRFVQQAQNLGAATAYVRGVTSIDHPLFTPGGTGNFGNAWMWDSTMLDLAVARPIAHKPLSKQGDSTIGIVTGDVAWRLKHPQAAMCIHAINSN